MADDVARHEVEEVGEGGRDGEQQIVDGRRHVRFACVKNECALPFGARFARA